MTKKEMANTIVTALHKLPQPLGVNPSHFKPSNLHLWEKSNRYQRMHKKDLQDLYNKAVIIIEQIS